MNRKLFQNFFLLTSLLVFCFACQAKNSKTANAQKNQVSSSQKVQLPEVKAGQPLPSDLFIKLAQKVNPSVVNIYTETQPKFRGMQGAPDSLQFFLDQFFGGNGPRGFSSPDVQPMQSLGTGFVIRNDGLILTNAHVVGSADVIKVKFQGDDTEYKAKLIGSDTKTDIALIKVKIGKKLAALKLGDSSKLQVGEWVAAFGNPYGHSNTMTKGIVSAVGRDSGNLNLFPFIQTDASINPGNSGGPLVNTRGEVIGMNTAIDARAQGIGFSIPINNVKQLLSELEKTGSVQRGFLGIEMARLDERIAKSLKLSNENGALVANVLKDSPADRAGLRPYDVIVSFNGKKIESPSDIQKVVLSTPVGKKVKLKVIRNGQRLLLDAKLGNPKSYADTEEESPQKRKAPSANQADLNDFGLSVSDLDQSLLGRLGLGRDQEGILVTEVAPYSPAFQAELRKGDIILELNKARVKSVSDFIKRLGSKNLLRVQRNQRTILTLMSK